MIDEAAASAWAMLRARLSRPFLATPAAPSGEAAERTRGGRDV